MEGEKSKTREEEERGELKVIGRGKGFTEEKTERGGEGRGVEVVSCHIEGGGEGRGPVGGESEVIH